MNKTKKANKDRPGKKATNKPQSTELADQVPPVRPTTSHDPFERFGFGDLAHWPTRLGRYWPDRIFGEIERSGLEGIKVEEYVDGDRLVVRAEVPGVDPEDIEVAIDDGRLSIRAERRSRTESSENGGRSEFRYGSFSRVLTLPEEVEDDDIEASCSDGILEVKIPYEDNTPTSRKTIPITRG